MRVLYLKIPARTTLTIASKINLFKIYFVWISIFALKSLPSYSRELNDRNDFDNYDWTHIKRQSFYPRIESKGIDNYISLNTLLIAYLLFKSLDRLLTKLEIYIFVFVFRFS